MSLAARPGTARRKRLEIAETRRGRGQRDPKRERRRSHDVTRRCSHPSTIDVRASSLCLWAYVVSAQEARAPVEDPGSKPPPCSAPAHLVKHRAGPEARRPREWGKTPTGTLHHNPRSRQHRASANLPPPHPARADHAQVTGRTAAQASTPFDIHSSVGAGRVPSPTRRHLPLPAGDPSLLAFN